MQCYTEANEKFITLFADIHSVVGITLIPLEVTDFLFYPSLIQIRGHYILLLEKKRLYVLNFHNYLSKINLKKINTSKNLVIFHC